MKKAILLGIMGLVISIIIINIIITSASTEQKIAIMTGMPYAESLGDGTFKQYITYNSMVNGVLDSSIAPIMINPGVDTQQTISKKITKAIIDDMATIGITITRKNVIIFNFNEGN